MLTDVGEYLVGAYLDLVEECDVIDYNVRPPGGGIQGLTELDLVGFSFERDTAYLCEVTTHIRGLLYRNNQETVRRIAKKHERQKAYAERYLTQFSNKRYQFWSPVVPVGYVTENLANLSDLELIINREYTARVEQLKKLARETAHDARNPVFRVLQILGHLRE